MSVPNSKGSRRAKRLRTATGANEAAARGKRARDHLARKRRQERMRLERDRWRAENSGSRALVRDAIGPILLVLALEQGAHVFNRL